MQQVPTYDTVARACEKLKAEGKKITGRSVVGIAGGSLITVLPLIKEWREKSDNALAVMVSEIPAELGTAILHALSLAQVEAAERETEALEALAEASREIEKLSSDLAEIKKQNTEEQRAAETAERSRTESAKTTLPSEWEDEDTGEAVTRVEIVENLIDEVFKGVPSSESAPGIKYKGVSRIDQTEKRTHGWYARVRFKGKSQSKFFSDVKCKGKDESLIAAIKWRDQTQKTLEQEAGSGPIIGKKH